MNIDPEKCLKTAVQNSLIKVIHVCITYSEDGAVFIQTWQAVGLFEKLGGVDSIYEFLLVIYAANIVRESDDIIKRRIV